jgi:hypothetical protein
MFNILTRQMDHCILTITNNGMYFMNKYKTGKKRAGEEERSCRILEVTPYNTKPKALFPGNHNPAQLSSRVLNLSSASFILKVEVRPDLLNRTPSITCNVRISF